MNKLLYPDIKYSNNFSIDIYKNIKLNSYFNNNNKSTLKIISELEKLKNEDYFEVPYIKNDYDWGYEIMYFPFTNKLLKILNNYKGDTSLQLHPLKNEKWISLKNGSAYSDGESVYDFNKFDYINIPSNTIHQLKINSLVFEEQDNNLFNNNETIRIFDALGRNVNKKEEYYKYLLPTHRNEIVRININEEKNILFDYQDKFLFILEGSVEFEINGNIVLLNEINKLYFLSKNCSNIKIKGIAKIIGCKYYEIRRM